MTRPSYMQKTNTTIPAEDIRRPGVLSEKLRPYLLRTVSDFLDSTGSQRDLKITITLEQDL